MQAGVNEVLAFHRSRRAPGLSQPRVHNTLSYLQWSAATDIEKHRHTGRKTAVFCLITIIIIIIIRLFPQLTIRNCYTTNCHAGQHRLARRPEQQGLARANAATNGAKQSCQPQPGRDLVGIHQMAPLEHTSDKQAYYSFIDPGRMKGWVGLTHLVLIFKLPREYIYRG